MEKNIPTEREIAASLVKEVIGRFQKAFDRTGIKSREKLFTSFVGNVITNSTGVDSMRITFLRYGRMVDMNVWRGNPIGGPKQSALDKHINSFTGMDKHRRKGKNWYSKPKTWLEKRTSELMMQHYGIQTIQVIEEGLPGDINIEL